MRQFNIAVVVGYGSIGKRHAKFLESHCETLILVDPRVTMAALAGELTSLQRIETYSDLNEVPIEFSIKDIVVIANWGPNHLETLELAVQKGVSQIVLEKPCADSMEELDKIWKLSEEKSLMITVNQGWYYTKLGNRIRQLTTSLELGEISAIWISGGARCLSTAGSHWVSLVNQIYGSNPLEICGHGLTHQINPRGPHLAYVEGVFSYSYPNDKRLGISLTNFSSVSGQINILWRDSVGILDQENIVVKSRKESEISAQITKYQEPSEVIFDGVVPFGSNVVDSQLESLYESFFTLSQEEHQQNLMKHLDSTRAIILSMISTELKKTIAFDSSLDSKLYERKFLIS